MKWHTTRLQMLLRPDVRFGSKADICNAKRHVRFTPKSGHAQCTRPCPLCANSGHCDIWSITLVGLPKGLAASPVVVVCKQSVGPLLAGAVLSISFEPSRATRYRMLNRRTLLVALGTTAFAVPNSSAQQHPGKPPQIGWLVPTTQAEWDGLLEEYRLGMRELGYIEGRTVETEYLYADGHFDRLPDLAAKLVEHKVDLIITASTPAIIAVKRATEKIPVVFAASSDPISTGVVASLARPGGNITGLSLMASDLSAKRLELIHTLVPRMSNIAVLWDSSNPGMAIRARENSGRRRTVQDRVFRRRSPRSRRTGSDVC